MTLLSVFLVASDVEVESKCNGTLYDAHMRLVTYNTTRNSRLLGSKVFTSNKSECHLQLRLIID